LLSLIKASIYFFFSSLLIFITFLLFSVLDY